MTIIVFSFSDYPMFVNKSGRRIAKITSGYAEIGVAEPVTVRDPQHGTLLIPFQRPLRWEVRSLDTREQDFDPKDLERFIRGRYSGTIDVLLYAKLFAEAGEDKHAKTFERLALR